MRSEIDTQQLNAFVDGELDVLGLREIEERMKHDEGLRAQVEALRQLRENLRDAADYHVAPEALRKRVAAMTAPPTTLATRLSVGNGTLQRWLNWRPMVVSFAVMALAVLTLNPLSLRLGHDERLSQEVVASHVRATLGQHLVDIASSDHHTVKPWLSSKLDFSPPVHELPIPGSVFLGGRVDYIDGRPVAALVYRQGEHIVDSFVWPTHAADSGVDFSADRGFQIAHWTRAGMSHWAISDVNRDEFMVTVRSLASPDGQHQRAGR